jgi:hypothetical protein
MNDTPIFDQPGDPDYDDPELLSMRLRDGIEKQLQRTDLSPQDREQYLQAYENLKCPAPEPHLGPLDD